jgi:hypothetical protein
MKNLFLIAAFLIGSLLGYFLCKTFTKNELIFSASSGKSKFLGRGKSQFGSADLYWVQAEEYLTNYKNTHSSKSSISFSIDSLDAAKLLNDPRCSGGLRVYLGVKNPKKPDDITLMFVGVDNNNDRENLFFTSGGKDYVIDYTNPCPTDCPPPINSTTNLNDRRTLKKAP